MPWKSLSEYGYYIENFPEGVDSTNPGNWTKRDLTLIAENLSRCRFRKKAVVSPSIRVNQSVLSAVTTGLESHTRISLNYRQENVDATQIGTLESRLLSLYQEQPQKYQPFMDRLRRSNRIENLDGLEEVIRKLVTKWRRGVRQQTSE